MLALFMAHGVCIQVIILSLPSTCYGLQSMLNVYEISLVRNWTSALMLLKLSVFG